MKGKQLRNYMIGRNAKTVNTHPEQLFEQFQRQQGLGLVQNVTLPFADQGERWDFQLDFARPTDFDWQKHQVGITFDIDFEIDGERYHNSPRQVAKDNWKDKVKNRQGLKVIHIPAALCERRHWEYLAREINRAILSKDPVVRIAA